LKPQADAQKGLARLNRSKLAIQSPKAPTPGRTTWPALVIAAGSRVTNAWCPTDSKAFQTLRKFPIP
jgi:hypothetical protein